MSRLRLTVRAWSLFSGPTERGRAPLLRVLHGLLAPEKGSVRAGGKALSSRRAASRLRLQPKPGVAQRPGGAAALGAGEHPPQPTPALRLGARPDGDGGAGGGRARRLRPAGGGGEGGNAPLGRRAPALGARPRLRPPPAPAAPRRSDGQPGAGGRGGGRSALAGGGNGRGRGLGGDGQPRPGPKPGAWPGACSFSHKAAWCRTPPQRSPSSPPRASKRRRGWRGRGSPPPPFSQPPSLSPERAPAVAAGPAEAAGKPPVLVQSHDLGRELGPLRPHPAPLHAPQPAGRFMSSPSARAKRCKTPADGNGDLLIAHHKPSEEAFVAEGHGLERRAFMYNDFVLLGPADRSGGSGAGGRCPRRLAADSVSDAGRAARSSSRAGDESGTPQARAGAVAGRRALAGGRPPPVARALHRDRLRHGRDPQHRRRARSLSACRTARPGSPSPTSAIVALLAEGPELRNEYGVIRVHPGPAPRGQRRGAAALAAWLVSKEGRAGDRFLPPPGRAGLLPPPLRAPPSRRAGARRLGARGGGRRRAGGPASLARAMNESPPSAELEAPPCPRRGRDRTRGRRRTAAHPRRQPRRAPRLAQRRGGLPAPLPLLRAARGSANEHQPRPPPPLARGRRRPLRPPARPRPRDERLQRDLHRHRPL